MLTMADPDSMENEEPTEGWVRIQKDTFANWINDKLQGQGVSVTNLRVDLRDGVTLCKLMCELKGEKIGRIKEKKNLNHYEAGANLQLAMQAMERDDIRLVNIGAEDISGGNLKLILGMCWLLIRRYQIGARSRLPTKKIMLAWINAVLHPDLQVTNFSSDWNDGVALHGLIEYCEPGSTPHWKLMDHMERVKNCNSGLSLAERLFGIPRVVSAENMASSDLDELSGMTYLSYFMAEGGPGYKATLHWVKDTLHPEPVEDFTTSWNDGNTIANLVQTLGCTLPDLSSAKPEGKCSIALSVSQREFSIPAFITARDILPPNADHIALMAHTAWLQALSGHQSYAPPARSSSEPLDEKPEVIEKSKPEDETSVKSLEEDKNTSQVRPIIIVSAGQQQKVEDKEKAVEENRTETKEHKECNDGNKEDGPKATQEDKKGVENKGKDEENTNEESKVKQAEDEKEKADIEDKEKDNDSISHHNYTGKKTEDVASEGKKLEDQSQNSADVDQNENLSAKKEFEKHKNEKESDNSETDDENSSNNEEENADETETDNETETDEETENDDGAEDVTEIESSEETGDDNETGTDETENDTENDNKTESGKEIESDNATESDDEIETDKSQTDVEAHIETDDSDQGTVAEDDDDDAGDGDYKTDSNDEIKKNKDNSPNSNDRNQEDKESDNKNESNNNNNDAEDNDDNDKEIKRKTDEDLPTNDNAETKSLDEAKQETNNEAQEQKEEIEDEEKSDTKEEQVQEEELAQQKQDDVKQERQDGKDHESDEKKLLDSEEETLKELEKSFSDETEPESPSYTEHPRRAGLGVIKEEEEENQPASDYTVVIPITHNHDDSANADDVKVVIKSEWAIDYAMTFHIKPPDSGERQFKVETLSPSESQGQLKVIQTAPSIYDVTFTPSEKGTWTIHVCDDKDVPVTRSPFYLNCYDVSKAEIDRDDDGPVPIDTPYCFHVRMAEVNSDAVRAHVAHNNESVPVEVTPAGTHVFKVTFTPEEAGRYLTSVYVGGLQVPGSPFTVKAEDIGAVTACGAGLHTGRQRHTSTFVVDTSAKRNRKLDITVTGPQGVHVPTECRTAIDGNQTTVNFVPPILGTYKVDVCCGNQKVSGSPFYPEVTGAHVYVHELQHDAVIGKLSSFMVDASEMAAGTLEIDSDLPVLNYQKEGDKRYRVTFVPKKAGKHDLVIKYNDIIVADSPYNINVSC